MKRILVAVLVMVGAARAGSVQPPAGGSTSGRTDQCAVLGPDLFFHDNTMPFKKVFNGVGTNTVIEGPTAVASGDGNFFVAYRMGGVDDRTTGMICYSKIAPDGTLLSTNILFQDTFYDCENAVIFKTKANTLLIAFNLYNYLIGINPSNNIRVLRSPYPWTNWTTNALDASYGTMIGGEMAQTGSGDVLLPSYVVYDYLHRSTDDGLTWGHETFAVNVNPRGYLGIEPSLLALGGNNLMMCIRCEGGAGDTNKIIVGGFTNTPIHGTNFICRSSDGGTNWTVPVAQWAMRSKINTIMLKNGLLLATYRGGGDVPYKATQNYRTSMDTGLTWTAERVFDPATNQNYSAAVELYPGMVGVFYPMITDSPQTQTNSPLFLAYGAYAGISPLGDVLGAPGQVRLGNPTWVSAGVLNGTNGVASPRPVTNGWMRLYP